MLNVPNNPYMLSVVMLSVVMLSVVMLNVVAPLEQRMLTGYSQKLVRSSYDHFYDEKLLPVRIKH
jgi:hypothetical protein